MAKLVGPCPGCGSVRADEVAIGTPTPPWSVRVYDFDSERHMSNHRAERVAALETALHHIRQFAQFSERAFQKYGTVTGAFTSIYALIDEALEKSRS